MPGLFDLTGHTALVAGGTGGIGQVLARALLDCRANVAVSGQSQTKADRVAEDLGGSARVLALSGNARRPGDLDRLVEATVERFGRLDIVVNCIGGNARHAAEDYPEDDWDRILDLNLKAAFLLSRGAARHMLRQPRRDGSAVAGKILHVSSVRSQLGIHSGYAAYCAAKGGLNVLVKQLATEWADRGILVNAIAPTFIRTEQVADMLGDPAFHQSLVQRIPLGRVGETDDLIGPMLLFVSHASDFVTGQILFVDGGLTACQ
jgi:gluconate 5-dehydrogenase